MVPYGITLRWNAKLPNGRTDADEGRKIWTLLYVMAARFGASLTPSPIFLPHFGHYHQGEEDLKCEHRVGVLKCPILPEKFSQPLGTAIDPSPVRIGYVTQVSPQ